jgi:hypothetical protein
MKLAYVIFANRRDAAHAIHELSRHCRVTGYRGGVWAVPAEQVERLDARGVAYRPATEDEVEAALAAIRYPAAALL